MKTAHESFTRPVNTIEVYVRNFLTDNEALLGMFEIDRLSEVVDAFRRYPTFFMDNLADIENGDVVGWFVFDQQLGTHFEIVVFDSDE